MNKTLFCCFGHEIGSPRIFFFYENAKFQHSKIISSQVLANDHSKLQLYLQKDCLSVLSVNFLLVRGPLTAIISHYFLKN